MSQLSQPQTLPLKPLHLPAEPAAWPLPWGYWVIICMILLSIILVVAYVVTTRQRQRPKAAALKMLKSNTETLTPSIANEILRQAVLSYYPRKEVAHLTGTSWWRFLDSQLTSPRFLPKEMAWQAALYTNIDVSEDDYHDLVADCAFWIHHALPPKKQYRNEKAAS